MEDTNPDAVPGRFKALEGWISLPVAARALTMTRQQLFNMASKGTIRHVREVPGLPGKRPTAILVRSAEIEKLRLARMEAKGCPKCRKEVEEAREAGRELDISQMFCEHREAPEDAAEDADVMEALGM